MQVRVERVFNVDGVFFFEVSGGISRGLYTQSSCG